MKAILINHNFTPNWLSEYDFDYLIYDRSDSTEYLKDFPQDRIIYTKNIGNVDWDRLSYLVDNYDNLPEVFLWSKSNLFKYISKPEFDEVKNNKYFTPLLTSNHKEILYDGTEEYVKRHGTFKDVSFYQGGMYYELNNSWYIDTSRRFQSYEDFARHFGLPNPEYLPFAPGGNYLLTRERVHRHSKEFYDEMRNVLPYTILPTEAHYCERSYYNLWK